MTLKSPFSIFRLYETFKIQNSHFRLKSGFLNIYPRAKIFNSIRIAFYLRQGGVLETLRYIRIYYVISKINCVVLRRMSRFRKALPCDPACNILTFDVIPEVNCFPKEEADVFLKELLCGPARYIRTLDVISEVICCFLVRRSLMIERNARICLSTLYPNL